eukprot:m.27970 g.27970  ORF g.27970 m.27970 type:complete len:279 (+) comp8693_c0_seq1:246-1082(+)
MGGVGGGGDGESLVSQLWYSAPRYGGENALLEYWPLVLGSCAVFFALEIVSDVVSPWVPGYTALSQGVKREWRVRLSGVTHAVVVSVMSVYALFLDPQRHLLFDDDPSFGWSPAAAKTCAISVGYFLWDLYSVVRDKQGVPYTLHAIGACSVFALVLWWNVGGWFAMHCFSYEFSTPLIHLRAVLLALHKQDLWVFPFIHYGSVVLFVVVRVFVGVPVQLWGMSVTSASFVGSPELRHTVLACVLWPLCIAMNGLNVFWFALIVQAVWKKSDTTAKSD